MPDQFGIDWGTPAEPIELKHLQHSCMHGASVCQGCDAKGRIFAITPVAAAELIDVIQIVIDAVGYDSEVDTMIEACDPLADLFFFLKTVIELDNSGGR